MTSNVSQNYPYTSETEADRASRIASLLAAKEELAGKLAAETTPLDANERWWVWKCPTKGCPGLLHAAGYAAEKHAVYVVCENPDALFTRATTAGAEVVRGLADEDYGSRGFTVRDPEGNLWTFGTYRGE